MNLITVALKVFCKKLVENQHFRRIEVSATKGVPNVPSNPARSLPNRALRSLRALIALIVRSFLAFQSFLNKRAVIPSSRVFISTANFAQLVLDVSLTKN